MNKKSIRDINVTGKRVLMRVDYNVPMDEHEQITDDTRIVASIPTINYLLEQGASVILISHLGRPKGKVQLKYSLAPIAKHLEIKIGRPVTFASDCLGERVQELAGKMVAGDILMLENLRFHPEEEENDWEFAEDLATLADIYVNDGFLSLPGRYKDLDVLKSDIEEAYTMFFNKQKVYIDILSQDKK